MLHITNVTWHLSCHAGTSLSLILKQSLQVAIRPFWKSSRKNRRSWRSANRRDWAVAPLPELLTQPSHGHAVTDDQSHPDGPRITPEWSRCMRPQSTTPATTSAKPSTSLAPPLCHLPSRSNKRLWLPSHPTAKPWKSRKATSWDSHASPTASPNRQFTSRCLRALTFEPSFLCQDLQRDLHQALLKRPSTTWTPNGHKADSTSASLRTRLVKTCGTSKSTSIRSAAMLVSFQLGSFEHFFHRRTFFAPSGVEGDDEVSDNEIDTRFPPRGSATQRPDRRPYPPTFDTDERPIEQPRPGDSSSFTVHLGERAEFNCNAEDNLMRTEWRRSDGRALPHGARIYGGQLVIENVRNDASGSYECVAYDHVSRRQITLLVARLVVVAGPPKITFSPPMPITVKAGEDINIYCNATGEGPLRVHWHGEGGYELDR